jgi:hypothetical protein
MSGMVSEQETNEVKALSKELHTKVTQWLKENHLKLIEKE